MSESRGRKSVSMTSLALVFGAMVFGMVLAGSVELTPTTEAAPEPAAGPVQLAAPVGGLPSFADLADAVSPAVAAIEVHTIERRSQTRRVDPFELFFRQRRSPRGENEEEEEDSEQRRDSAGSGFVISADGLMITNFHVIDGATGVTVTIDGKEYRAEVKGTDPATDIALLQIDNAGRGDFAYLELGDSESLRVGDWIMVIGSPLRLANSVSVGVVSAKGRSINITPDRSLENFIQTDAAINFGNSGGPLVNLRGEVVGIATAINYGAENIGFAVPVTTLQGILPQLRETGTVKRGYLGVNIRTVDERIARAFDLDTVGGVLAQEVVKGGPSEEAGLENGDVIVSVDGRPVADTRTLIDYVSSLEPGKKVALEVVRGGKRMTKKVELGERNLTSQVAEAAPEEQPEREIEWLGLEYQDLTDSVRENHQIPEDVGGVWVRAVSASSPLYRENVVAGDVIVSVNGQAIDSVRTFEQLVGDTASGGLLRMYVRRYDPRTGQQVIAFYAFVDVP